VPDQLVSDGGPELVDDIVVFSCRAGITTDLGFSHFRVSGWKRVGAEVTLAFGD